jgi:hypothetical protein
LKPEGLEIAGTRGGAQAWDDNHREFIENVMAEAGAMQLVPGSENSVIPCL